MRIVLACLVVVIGIISGLGAAAAYHQIGAGIDSCGTWTADRSNPRGVAALQDEQWVVGFLSGVGFVNQDGDDPLIGVDAEAVWAWIDNYCHANPLASIARAAAQFYMAHPHQ